MISFWEKESFIHYDYIIIGAGIVGLSTALSIKERRPNASIAVLEKGILPTGASTKNAGFACFGSLTELQNDISTIGKEGALKLVETRVKGLNILKRRLGEENIDYQQYGGYELIGKNEIDAIDQLETINNWLAPLFDQPVFNLRPEMIRTFGFATEHVKNLIYNPFEGQLDTGKMMKWLVSLSGKNDIRIFTGTEVINFEESGSVEVITKSGNAKVSFITNRLIVCTNAFTKALIPEFAVTPGRGLVLVTHPIKNLKFSGTFHMDQGYYYFRNFNDRVILGGGRNLFFEEESTTDFEINQKIYTVLLDKLKTEILPTTDFDIDMSWTGIMAFGKTKQPIVKWHSEKILAGIRLGGMGVAIGSKVGEELAQMATEDGL